MILKNRLKNIFLLLAAAALLSLAGPGFSAAADAPRVLLKTNLGDIVLELNPEKAPQTTANFLEYIKSGHYNGTLFHRVIPGFMIQGGGFADPLLRSPKPARDPIPNEAGNGLKNLAYTMAMARTNAPHSATAQFFINTADNDFLDYRGPASEGGEPEEWGYAVFGRVVEGREVVDVIEKVATGAEGPHQNVPVKPVVIEEARLVE